MDTNHANPLKLKTAVGVIQKTLDHQPSGNRYMRNRNI